MATPTQVPSTHAPRVRVSSTEASASPSIRGSATSTLDNRCITRAFHRDDSRVRIPSAYRLVRHTHEPEHPVEVTDHKCSNCPYRTRPGATGWQQATDVTRGLSVLPRGSSDPAPRSLRVSARSTDWRDDPDIGSAFWH